MSWNHEELWFWGSSKMFLWEHKYWGVNKLWRMKRTLALCVEIHSPSLPQTPDLSINPSLKDAWKRLSLMLGFFFLAHSPLHIHPVLTSFLHVINSNLLLEVINYSSNQGSLLVLSFYWQTLASWCQYYVRHLMVETDHAFAFAIAWPPYKHWAKNCICLDLTLQALELWGVVSHFELRWLFKALP